MAIDLSTDNFDELKIWTFWMYILDASLDCKYLFRALASWAHFLGVKSITFMEYTYGITILERCIRMLEKCNASYTFPNQVV